MIPNNLLVVASLSIVTIQCIAEVAPLRFKQERDGDAIKLLTGAEFSTLGDPMFRLVLKDSSSLTDLDAIMAKLQPVAEMRRLFVVHERIVSDKPGASRRGVMAFTGTNNGEALNGNVMLSFTLQSNGDTPQDLEAWGWDNHRGRYNYYKLDEIGAPPGKLTWKFRGSSQDADLLSAVERKGTCLQCHTTGAPVMKELLFPWNNWHSRVGGAFKASYLDPASPLPQKWPLAMTPLLRNLAGADELEDDHLIPAFKRFNESRVNALLLRDDATGDRLVVNKRLTLTSASRLLRSLFVPTEVNLISSRDTSGIHPFGTAADFDPTKRLRIPDDFFLHTTLIGGGNEITGLQLADSKEFTARDLNHFATLTQAENKALAEKFKLRVNGELGDAHFAWLVPTPSFIDTEMADRLLKLGAVTPHFVAAVVAVDLEEPLFSEKRARLLKYLPQQFAFTPLLVGADVMSIPRDQEKDLLTKLVIANIEADNPMPGTPEHEFGALLKDADAVVTLKSKVQAYVKRVKTALSDPDTRAAELERLFGILVERRKAMLSNRLFAPLDETGGRLLLPMPAGE